MSAELDIDDYQYTCTRVYFDGPVIQPAYIYQGQNVCLGCVLVCCGTSKQSAIPALQSLPNEEPALMPIICRCVKISENHCQFSKRDKNSAFSADVLVEIQSFMLRDYMDQHASQKQPMSPSSIQLPEEKSIVNRITAQLNISRLYTSHDLQQQALRCIPLDRLLDNCRQSYTTSNSTHVETTTMLPYDAFLPGELTRQLLQWFKTEFFTWTNRPTCPSCPPATESQSYGTSAPSEEERHYLASVVELYQCVKCKKTIRFPRYNHPGKLLETRQGRCGEWANAFTLCCISVGLKARVVLDWTDHIWTEVFFNGEWTHCDSCENAWNTPALYENGWGKKLTLCVAVGPQGIQDVTRRYASWTKELIDRRMASIRVPEDRLNDMIDYLNDYLVSKNDIGIKEDGKNWHEIRQQEKMILGNVSVVGSTPTTLLPIRQSGSVEWRESRGEMGCHQTTKPP